ncbi:helix-turn-helix domain-containing protein [Cytobacillus kochii]|uniref:HTH cro/C1-type domain-containing protein n=1 Tax=Cytobacillus kochii TaxID=859143 RepID=A0A248TGA3_9BACI|nr:helix-turn-helix transcriptional regulator [Cytobacillus kochii]ASV67226.1 hypothetical protein CKF48_07720 [Cytobacillus kochii]
MREKANPKEFGSELKKLRKERKMTLIELGAKIDLTQAYLSMIENGKQGIPTPGTLKKIAKGLNIHHAKLMEMAGYETTIIEAFTGVLEEQRKKVEISLPAMGKDKSSDGLTAYGLLTDDELRRRVFDLYDLLDLDVDLYYKKELLNDKNREKIKNILQIILE